MRQKKMNSLLQLRDYTITRLRVDWSEPGGAKGVPSTDMLGNEGQIKVGYNVMRNRENDRSFALEFSCVTGPADTKTDAGYIVDAKIVGFFDFPADASEEAMQRMIRVNGTTILYGVLRGHVSSVTGAFPAGKHVLPTVNMLEMVKEIEEGEYSVQEDVRTETIGSKDGLQVYKVTTTKEKIDRLPISEKVFLLQTMTIQQELATLYKLAFMFYKPGGEGVEAKARVGQLWVLLFLLSGKLVEAWNALLKSPKSKKVIDGLLENFDLRGKQAYTSLRRFFGSDAAIQWYVRNKHAFHYDWKEAKENLALLENEEEIEWFLAETRGNVYSSLPTLLVARRILKEKNSASPDDLKVYYEEIKTVTGWFLDLVERALVSLVKKHPELFEMADSITIGEVAKESEVELPYFVST